MKLKLHDIYHFHRKERDNHCKEDLLIVYEVKDELILYDTFWGLKFKWDGGRNYTLEDALERGVLEYYCNLNELTTEISNRNRVYYDNEDIYWLHTQEQEAEYAEEYARNYKEKLKEVQSGNLDITI